MQVSTSPEVRLVEVQLGSSFSSWCFQPTNFEQYAQVKSDHIQVGWNHHLVLLPFVCTVLENNSRAPKESKCLQLPSCQVLSSCSQKVAHPKANSLHLKMHGYFHFGELYFQTEQIYIYIYTYYYYLPGYSSKCALAWWNSGSGNPTLSPSGIRTPVWEEMIGPSIFGWKHQLPEIYLTLYWLVYRDPYIDLLKSPYNWVV